MKVLCESCCGNGCLWDEVNPVRDRTLQQKKGSYRTRGGSPEGSSSVRYALVKACEGMRMLPDRSEASQGQSRSSG